MRSLSRGLLCAVCCMSLNVLSSPLMQAQAAVRAERTSAENQQQAAPAEPTGLTTMESPHYQNFIDAIRAGDPKVLACDILEGHLSSTLPHLANISYRVGRALVFDGKREAFVNDKEADRLLTRDYRKGFEIPKFTIGESAHHEQAKK